MNKYIYIYVHIFIYIYVLTATAQEKNEQKNSQINWVESDDVKENSPSLRVI